MPLCCWRLPGSGGGRVAGYGREAVRCSGQGWWISDSLAAGTVCLDFLIYETGEVATLLRGGDYSVLPDLAFKTFQEKENSFPLS